MKIKFDPEKEILFYGSPFPVEEESAAGKREGREIIKEPEVEKEI